jgi:hypothetical protein
MADERTTFDKVMELLKKEMDTWTSTKKTGQIQLELNYSCGGLSKVYLTTKNSIK